MLGQGYDRASHAYANPLKGPPKHIKEDTRQKIKPSFEHRTNINGELSTTGYALVTTILLSVSFTCLLQPEKHTYNAQIERVRSQKLQGVALHPAFPCVLHRDDLGNDHIVLN